MKLASLFSDHLVLQRDQAVPVWGWAEPGEAVTVLFAGQRKTIRAGTDGKWQIYLDAMPANMTPAALTVNGGKSERLTVEDVLVGDVYLCSGQSNMQWVVSNCFDAAAEQAAANFPLLRHFSVPLAANLTPPADVNGSWSVCSPQTVGKFTAVGYFFAREIHRVEGVPIGLLNNAWGGTRIETWISRAMLLTDEPCRREVENYDTQCPAVTWPQRQQIIAEYQADPNGWLQRNVRQDPGNRGFEQGWAAPALDDKIWPTMELPATWQSRGVANNGVVWFRRSVDVPPDWEGRDLQVSLGVCDKHDVTYFNGEEIGRTGWETPEPWLMKRAYAIPGRLVRPGRNVIATRIYSFRNAGGMTGAINDLYLELGGQRLPLAGNWRYQIEHDFGVIRGSGVGSPLPDQNSLSMLYDNLIAPMAPFSLRGFVWYQGESNADNHAEYHKRFGMLIRDWRKTWDREVPFLFVQLANYNAGPSDSWPRLREAQLQMLSEPQTAMAVTIDIGNPADIHPQNKQEVGRRLALAAEALIYKRALVASGPTFTSLIISGREARVSFANIAGGLKVARRFDDAGRPKTRPEPDGAPTGFELAGADRQFHRAEARIDGNGVILSSDKVPQPVAVRYGWKCDPACKLYNTAWLAASPFRTDTW